MEKRSETQKMYIPKTSWEPKLVSRDIFHAETEPYFHEVENPCCFIFKTTFQTFIICNVLVSISNL